MPNRITSNWDQVIEARTLEVWQQAKARSISYAKEAHASGNIKLAMLWRINAVHYYMCIRQRRLFPKRTQWGTYDAA